jgi:peptidoglycan/LPS O-acetylase OafA/YrhL
MYEVFPLVAGVVIALLVPRFVPSRQRRFAYAGGFGALSGVAATIIAGEEWFFVFVDLAEVLIAMGVTLAIVASWPGRRTTPLH